MISHRAHNKIIHALHGNGSSSAEDGPRLFTLNTSGLLLPPGYDARIKDDSSLSSSVKRKKSLIEAALALHQPAIVCLQELRGDADALLRVRMWLRSLGYHSAAVAGECADHSEHSSHRHGGVATAWREREFEEVKLSKRLLTHMAALLLDLGCASAHSSGRAMIVESAAPEEARSLVTPYAGKRAMAVHLRRMDT